MVYYTALLITVGCHSDAHEQAKWFGDDIALKADQVPVTRLTEPRGAVATMACSAAGQPAAAPVPRRPRVRHLGPQGHRRHDQPTTPRSPGPRRAAGPAAPVVQGVGAAYEQWDGKGWPGTLKGEAVPVGGAHRAARRVHGGGPPSRWHRSRHEDGAGSGRASNSTRHCWPTLRGPDGQSSTASTPSRRGTR